MAPRSALNRKNIMREFTIAELSAVDRPAQAHARAVIMKRDVSKDYGELTPAVAHQQIEAVDFDTILAEMEAREAAREVGEDLSEKWIAMQRSFATIACDETLSAPEKIIRMQESLQQYIASLAEQSATIAEEMTKSICTAAPALAELLEKVGNEGDMPMTDAEKKQLAELQKNLETLKAQLEAATATDAAKKAAELTDALAKAQAQVTELTEKLAKSDAEKAEAAAKAGMSDDDKTYMESLDEKARKEFMGMSPEDREKTRKASAKKAADDNPVVYKSADGVEFRKNDDPRLIAMAKRADENEKRAAEEVEKREAAEFEKRAGEEPFAKFTATAEEKVAVVRAISKIDDKAARDTLEKMLTIGAKAIGAAFERIGNSSEELAKSARDFEKKVADIQGRDKCSRSEAMSKARAEDPTAFAAYQGSIAGTN